MTFLKKWNFYDFLKNRNFRNLTTDFETSHKATSWDQSTRLFGGWPLGYTYTGQVLSILQAWNFHPFRTLPVWVQNLKNSITRYSWEKKKNLENVSKLTNLWFKSPRMDWTCSVGYGLVINVQKDACFGLSLRLCTIFEICSQFSKIAIF